MKRIFLSLFLVFNALLPASLVLAASERGNAEEAIALVKKGSAFLKANGLEQGYAAISDPKGQFVDRDLYLFVFDATGKTLAHGANAKLIGKSLIDLKDSDDKYFIKEFLELASKKGKGWVDYKWPHPITKTIEHKSTYIEKLENGTIIGCGIYK
ncbi:MAG: cache domain-containing protein [Pseudomonadota bacterium]